MHSQGVLVTFDKFLIYFSYFTFSVLFVLVKYLSLFVIYVRVWLSGGGAEAVGVGDAEASRAY